MQAALRRASAAVTARSCAADWRVAATARQLPAAARQPRALTTSAQRNAYEGSVGEAAAPGLAGGAKRLSDLAKVPLLTQETSVRVREIWLERYQENEFAVAGVMAQEEYHQIYNNAKSCPLFLVPVPRGEGYMNLVWQFQNGAFVYQTVESFQQGITGQVDFGFALFAELLNSHQLALLHGTLQSQLLTKAEAGNIVRYTREAYMDPARFEWIRRFNQEPREFDYEEFLNKFKPLERWEAGE